MGLIALLLLGGASIAAAATAVIGRGGTSSAPPSITGSSSSSSSSSSTSSSSTSSSSSSTSTRGGATAARRDDNATAAAAAAAIQGGGDPLTALDGALTPTQFLRLSFPIPRTLRARETLRLEDSFGFDLLSAPEGGKQAAAARKASHGRPSSAIISSAGSGPPKRSRSRHYEILVDRYEDGPDGACYPSSSGGGVEADGAMDSTDEPSTPPTTTPSAPTCNLRAALRWAVGRQRQQQQEEEEMVVTTIYLPTRWPHLLTLNELEAVEKGCVRGPRWVCERLRACGKG
jgi:hypothetical protein